MRSANVGPGRLALWVVIGTLLTPLGLANPGPDPVIEGISPAICVDQIPPWSMTGYCQGNIPPIVVCPFGEDGIDFETTPADLSVPFPCLEL